LICEICTGDDWEQLRGNWARCKRCGRLETTNEPKKCIDCGTKLGSYAKKKQKLCLKCIKKNKKNKCKKPCHTKGCFNKHEHNINRTCKQCLRENEEEPNLHLWKTQALKILSKETKRNELIKKIKETYKKISKHSILSWLRKAQKEGAVTSPKFGSWVAVEPTNETNRSKSDFISIAPVGTVHKIND
jgi:hypothetical protein